MKQRYVNAFVARYELILDIGEWSVRRKVKWNGKDNWMRSWYVRPRRHSRGRDW